MWNDDASMRKSKFRSNENFQPSTESEQFDNLRQQSEIVSNNEITSDHFTDEGFPNMGLIFYDIKVQHVSFNYLLTFNVFHTKQKLSTYSYKIMKCMYSVRTLANKGKYSKSL